MENVNTDLINKIAKTVELDQFKFPPNISYLKHCNICKHTFSTTNINQQFCNDCYDKVNPPNTPSRDGLTTSSDYKK